MAIIKNSINFIFKNFFIFLLCLIWCNFYIQNRTLAFVLAIFLCVIISFLLKIFLEKINAKKALTKKEKKQLLDFKNYLLTSQKQTQKQILKTLTKNKISYLAGDFLLGENVLVFMFFDQNLTKQNILKSCKKAKTHKIKKLVFLCIDLDNKIEAFSKTLPQFQIEIYDGETLFNMLKEQNFKFKKEVEIKTTTKLKFANFLSIFFNKKNAKTFFILGISTLFSSFLTFFKFYYYLLSTLLFVFGFVCLIKKQPQNKQKLLV